MALTVAYVEEQIEAVLAACASGAVEYQYNGRRVRKADFPLLLAELRRLRSELRAEASQVNNQGFSLGRCRAG